MCLSASQSHAIDINAHDWVYLPPGTKLGVSYTQYGTRSEFHAKDGTKISDGTNLESVVEVLRYVHVVDIAGFTTALEVIQPVGTLYNGELGGADLGHTSGWGDTTLTALVYLYHNKESATAFGIAPFLSVPLGQYSETDALNLGENRWKLDLQASWHQGLGNGFHLQLAGAVVWYGDNDDAGAATLSQDNTYYFQGWLSYDFAPTWNAGIGYAKYWGGEQFLDGLATGNATEKDQIRFELSKFITPTFQVLGDVSHDLETSGAFREDFRGTLRLLKVF